MVVIHYRIFCSCPKIGERSKYTSQRGPRATRLQGVTVVCNTLCPPSYLLHTQQACIFPLGS